jgi:hypothetical protein
MGESVGFAARLALAAVKTPANALDARAVEGFELLDLSEDSESSNFNKSFGLLLNIGQRPVISSGQAELSAPVDSVACSFSCRVFRQTPGVSPKRRLKQVLNKPK